MAKIFISYRRDDSRKDAGRIYDRLVGTFGKENVFKDVDNIPLGMDFRGVLREAVAQCDVLLAIIGKKWLSIDDGNGNRRLDDSGDFVRLEIVSALQRHGIIVIPILIDHASMPSANDLPDDLRELAYKNATIMRDDPDFNNDISRLIRSLQAHFDTLDGNDDSSAPIQTSNTKIFKTGIFVTGFVVVALLIGIVAFSIFSSNSDGDPLPTATSESEAIIEDENIQSNQPQIVFYHRVRESENSSIYSLYIATQNEAGQWVTKSLLEGGEGKWYYTNEPSPDGTQIAYYSNQNSATNIWLMNTNGTNEPIQLTDNSGFNIWGGISWSPDSKSIIFIKDINGQPQVHRLDVDSPDTMTQITHDADLGSHTAAWSPEDTDGRYIVYSRFIERQSDAVEDSEDVRNLWIYDLKTGADYELIGSDLDTWNPAWSPDGKYIAYTSDVKEDVHCEIFRVSIDIDDEGFVSAGTPTRLTDNNACDWWADYSPDGTQIAYYSNETQGIRIMDAQGGEMADYQVVNDYSGDDSISEGWPRWLPPVNSSN